MACDIPEPWRDVSSIELDRFVREYPRPLEARPPLSQRKVNYREWLDPTLAEWPANVVAKSRRWRVSAFGTTDAPAASLEGGSPARVFIQKGKHVGLPYAHAEMEKVVPLVHGGADWRIDLQAMRLTGQLATGV